MTNQERWFTTSSPRSITHTYTCEEVLYTFESLMILLLLSSRYWQYYFTTISTITVGYYYTTSISNLTVGYYYMSRLLRSPLSLLIIIYTILLTLSTNNITTYYYNCHLVLPLLHSTISCKRKSTSAVASSWQRWS